MQSQTVVKPEKAGVEKFYPAQQMKCKAGCGRVLHHFCHVGPKGPVYVCERCGTERTA